MARKKKLNKRVVALLAVMGAMVLCLGVALALTRLPMDPAKLAAKAEAAANEGDYAAAISNYDEAIRQASKGTPEPTYYYKVAKIHLDWMKKDSAMIQMDRLSHYGAAKNRLQTVLQMKTDYVDALRLYCELLWEEANTYKRWSEFIKEGDKLVLLDKTDHKLQYELAVACAALNKNLGGAYKLAALEHINKAIELKKDQLEYWVYKVAFQRDQNLKDDSVATIKEAIEANPKKPELYVFYSNVLLNDKHKEDALAQLEQAVSVAPESTTGELALANYYRNENQLDQALEHLQLAMKIDDTDYRIYSESALILLMQNKPDDSLLRLREGQQKIKAKADGLPASDTTGLRTRLLNGQAELNYATANLLLDRADVATTEAEKRKLTAEVADLLAQLPTAGTANKNKIQGRIALAEASLQTSEKDRNTKLDQAIDLLEKAYSGFSAYDIQTGRLLINLYISRGVPGKALAIVDKYLDLPGMGTDVQVLTWKARILRNIHRYEQCYEVVRQILRLAPENADALQLKVELDLASGHNVVLPPDAKLAASIGASAMDQAERLWMDGRQAEGLKLADDVSARWPDELSLVSRVVSLYLAAGKEDLAQAALEKAAKSHKDDETIKRQLALLKEKSPDKRLEMRLAWTNEIADSCQRELAISQQYALAGKKEEYLAHLNAAAKIDPKNMAVMEGQFRAAMGSSDWKAAADVAKRLGDVDATNGRLAQAQIELAQGNYQKAVNQLVEALHDNPEMKEPRVLLGNCYMQLKEFKNAQNAFQTVATNDPSYAPAIVGMARVTAQLGLIQEHEGWIQQAGNLHVSDPDIRDEYLLSQESQDPAEIIRKREAIRKTSPDEFANVFRLAVLYERAASATKDKAVQQRNMAQAEEAYQDIYKRSSDPLRGTGILLDFYTRNNRQTDVQRVLNEMMSNPKDKVGAQVLLGQFSEPLTAGRAFQAAIDADGNDPRGYEALARQQAGLKHWKEAAETIRKFLILKPGTGRAEQALAGFFIDGEMYDEAAVQLDKMLKADPANPETLTKKGALLMRRNKLDEAQAVLTEALDKNPNFSQALVYRAQISLMRGDTEGGKRDLSSAMLMSHDPDVMRQLASVHLYLHEFDRAESIYKDILAAQPDYQKGIVGLSQVYLTRQKWQQLEPLLVEAHLLFHKEAVFWQIEAEMWASRSIIDRRLAALKTAYEIRPDDLTGTLRSYVTGLLEADQAAPAMDLIKACASDPKSTGWPKALAGRAMAKLRKFDEADKWFGQAVNDSTSNELMYIIGQLELSYGLTESIRKVDGWATARPDDWRMRLFLAMLYNKTEVKENLPKALLTLAEGRKRAEGTKATDRERAQLDEWQGIIYHAMKDFDQAEKFYKLALKEFPQNPTVLNNLAYLYTDDKKQPKDALPYAKQASEMMPNDANVLDTFGWTLIQLGLFAQAEPVIGKALQLSEPQAILRYHAGVLYEKTSRPEEARNQFKLAYEMISNKLDDPLYKDLQAAMDRVRPK